jgi:hypothetical protein
MARFRQHSTIRAMSCLGPVTVLAPASTLQTPRVPLKRQSNFDARRLFPVPTFSRYGKYRVNETLAALLLILGPEASA